MSHACVLHLNSWYKRKKKSRASPNIFALQNYLEDFVKLRLDIETFSKRTHLRIISRCQEYEGGERAEELEIYSLLHDIQYVCQDNTIFNLA